MEDNKSTPSPRALRVKERVAAIKEEWMTALGALAGVALLSVMVFSDEGTIAGSPLVELVGSALPSMPDCSFHRPQAGLAPDIGTMAWCMIKSASSSDGTSSGSGYDISLFSMPRH
jgi:hypothetical protein